MNTIKIGISRCLLGEEVRYDGSHKMDSFFKKNLSKYAKLIDMCPEVDCGLSTPREPIHLEGSAKKLKLITNFTNVDLTPKMNQWLNTKSKQIQKLNLAGFILKSKSPSCGVTSTKILKKNKIQSVGSGIFSQMLKVNFSSLILVEEKDLQDDNSKLQFFSRIYIFDLWKILIKNPTNQKLISFHNSNKLFLMSYSITNYKKLEKTVDSLSESNIEQTLNLYFKILLKTYTLKRTHAKNIKTLKQIQHSLKTTITKNEYNKINLLMEKYHNSSNRFNPCLTYIKSITKKYNLKELNNQTFFSEEPFYIFFNNLSF